MAFEQNGKDQAGRQNIEVLSETIDECIKKRDFFRLTIRILFSYLKEVSNFFEEKESEDFKEALNDLIETFTVSKNLDELKVKFFHNKNTIVSFLNRERHYLKDKECEYKNIITILTEGIAALNICNNDFNEKLLEQGHKIEQISYLDDIRILKIQLLKEIQVFKDSIKEKQTKDKEQIDRLTKEVTSLKSELEKAMEASTIDSLTGAYNRMAFDNYMVSLFQDRRNRKVDVFSMLMVDIDDFKKINDFYGHQVGDRVLVGLVNKCKTHIRKEDFLARYGGEEFVIILVGSTLDDGLKKANQICKDVFDSELLINDMVGQDENSLKFTISIGVSVLHSDDTIERVSFRSDKALYKAKQTGKNKAVSELEC